MPLDSRPSVPGFTCFDASKFYFEEVFEAKVRESIEKATECHYLLCVKVPPEWAINLFDHFDEWSPLKAKKQYDCRTRLLRIVVMPVKIHSTGATWLGKHLQLWRRLGQLSEAELDVLEIDTDTTLKFNQGQYNGSRKQPDCMLWPQNTPFPTATLESGWSETMASLIRDQNVLLAGGNGHIKVVILVKWFERANRRVAGTVEVWRRDSNGQPFKQGSVSIFPRPFTVPRPLVIRRDELFTQVLPARNPGDLLELDVEELRSIATRHLAGMNLQPA